MSLSPTPGSSTWPPGHGCTWTRVSGQPPSLSPPSPHSPSPHSPLSYLPPLLSPPSPLSPLSSLLLSPCLTHKGVSALCKTKSQILSCNYQVDSVLNIGEKNAGHCSATQEPPLEHVPLQSLSTWLLFFLHTPLLAQERSPVWLLLLVCGFCYEWGQLPLLTDWLPWHSVMQWMFVYTCTV